MDWRDISSGVRQMVTNYPSRKVREALNAGVRVGGSVLVGRKFSLGGAVLRQDRVGPLDKLGAGRVHRRRGSMNIEHRTLNIEHRSLAAG